MGEMPAGDPYVENVLRNVREDVARTLKPEQWQGIREALQTAHTPTRHLVDVRFVVPLYFVRLYCVLLLGRDRRRRVARILYDRRRRVGRFAAALFLAAFTVVLLAVLFLVLYVVKSAAGIDLFPNFHLGDWLP